MEIINTRALSDLGMDDPSFIIDSLENISTYTLATSFGEIFDHSPPHTMSDFKRFNETYHAESDRPAKMVKNNSWDSSITDQLSNPQSTFPRLVTFANSNHSTQVKHETVQDKILNLSFDNQNRVFKACQEAKKASRNTRAPCSQDHIVAERKRREKLSQKFIALSALVPGLKKMDKASVLGDSIKYLKQLQEQVKSLEEQTKKKTIESVVFVKKHDPYANDDDLGSDTNFSSSSGYEPLLEIEARVCEENVLIRIHCEKKKGIVEKSMAEIEKLHFDILNSSVLSFGSSILDITIIAQMDARATVSIMDLVKHLRESFKLFE